MPVLIDLLQAATQVVGAATAVAAALAAIPGSPLRKAIESWIERRVSHRFDIALEDHRHQLTLEAERVRTRYQSDLHNLAIVAERRHEVCRELFRLVYIAQGKVAGLFGARETPAFEQYSRDEVAEYMSTRRFGANLRDPVLAQWDTNRQAAVRHLRSADRVVEVALASESYAEAWNYFLMNSLYLPDDATDLARRAFDPLWSILGAAKLPAGTYRGRDITQLQRESSDLIWQLRARLQAVLGLSADEPEPHRGPAA